MRQHYLARNLCPAPTATTRLRAESCREPEAQQGQGQCGIKSPEIMLKVNIKASPWECTNNCNRWRRLLGAFIFIFSTCRLSIAWSSACYYAVLKIFPQHDVCRFWQVYSS
ncbi:hypothetical protein L218DRAFT_673178 [Marasmius fiardii PR-910]|nr:hypothetical protein L218DRAFT_673178 [Marasmius fiardii PR-910]